MSRIIRIAGPVEHRKMIIKYAEDYLRSRGKKTETFCEENPPGHFLFQLWKADSDSGKTIEEIFGEEIIAKATGFEITFCFI